MNVLRRDLRAISADGAASNVMVGIGETYFPAFVLAVSHNQVASGLAATVPMVFGAILQLVTPRGVYWCGSYRRWVVVCALVQALAFVPLVVAALFGAMSVWLAFAVIAVYWATGLSGGSVWNAWVDGLVPAEMRARYFAHRTVIAQAGLLAGIVCGGLLLYHGRCHDWLTTAFALVFVVAAASRLLSGWFLGRQSAPVSPRSESPPMAFGESLRALSAPGTGTLLWYLFAVQAAVQIAGPYFTPYMLKTLEFSYGTYVALISTAYVAKILCLPLLGRIAERFGPQRLLWIGGVAIVPVPALWVFSNHFAFLAAVQVLSGAAWGAYELAMLLLFFRSIPRHRRVGLMTVYNLANSSASLVGSLVGGAMLALAGSTREVYWALFLLSAVARVIALLLLDRVPQTTPAPQPFSPRPALDAARPAPAWIGGLAAGQRISK